MKTIFIKPAACFSFCILQVLAAACQADTAKANAYDKFTLKDLLSIKIVSVSKQSEFLFDAPLSASVITRENIQQSGCTSVMEAMRLVPGLIVRQQTNGNYDINIRGMDNVPPNTSFDVAATTTLVMIDNRPIYSYLRGGTFWETLPVDLNDIEKIEIIRGPAAALYGPNAVNGVINIITSHTKKDGLYIAANNQQGSNKTFVNNASVGFQAEKFSIIASGNYQDRQRSQTSYFEFNRNTWIDDPAFFLDFRGDTVRNISQRFPDQGLAMRKYAANVFIDYNPSKKVKINIDAGTQHSLVQKIVAENEITPLSTASSDSRYINFQAGLSAFTAQLSYNNGTQAVDHDPGNKFDFNTLDASIEYRYQKGNFSLKPGLSYRSATYDDTRYSDIIHRAGIFNSEGTISTQSASLRGEYKLMNNKLRLIAGLAASKFNYPNATYASYEMAATYKINKNHLFRMVYSHAPRSSNIFDTYADQAIVLFPSGPNSFTEIAILGSKNLKLLTAGMMEIGYRGQIAPNFNLDVELFDIRSKNYNVPVQSSPIIEFDGADTVHETPIRATNLPVTLSQTGMTISFNYSSAKVQVKPFVTIQHSVMKNYSMYLNTADAAIPGAAQNNIYSAMNKKETVKSTPTLFGGATINYIPVTKLNINTTMYFYSAQTYLHLSNLLFNDGIRGIDHLNGKLLLNLNVSYKAAKGLHIFCNGKNLLNNRSREFFRSDAVPLTVIAGFSYEL